MAHTVELLSLIEDYPDAFLEPTEAPLTQSAKTISSADSSTNTALLTLMSEFPEAFVEPETPDQSKPQSKTNSTETEAATQPGTMEPVESAIPTPAGYELAFHQEIQTFGWGTVNVQLRYDRETLIALWITVGKSGTEVQSFCEAIARLTNRLLAAGTPMSDLVKELRGIRGGESEGMGPHRFLGLVDLFGKVLQDAPTRMVMQTERPATAEIASTITSSTSDLSQVSTSDETKEASQITEMQKSSSETTDQHQWVVLSDTSAIASICPECGAELQQVNGCSGGACVVCGFSSCS